MWWNIAASNGQKSAGKNRQIVAKNMTLSQIEKAQDLARECVAKNYKGCWIYAKTFTLHRKTPRKYFCRFVLLNLFLLVNFVPLRCIALTTYFAEKSLKASAFGGLFLSERQR